MSVAENVITVLLIGLNIKYNSLFQSSSSNYTFYFLTYIRLPKRILETNDNFQVGWIPFFLIQPSDI